MKRIDLEKRREELKNDRYRCYRCGQIETPILVGDVGDGAEYGEPNDRVLGYACENPECVSDAVRPYLEVGRGRQDCSHPGAGGPCLPRISDSKCIWCEREMRPLKRSLESVHSELRSNT